MIKLSIDNTMKKINCSGIYINVKQKNTSNYIDISCTKQVNPITATVIISIIANFMLLSDRTIQKIQNFHII